MTQAAPSARTWKIGHPAFQVWTMSHVIAVLDDTHRQGTTRAYLGID